MLSCVKTHILHLTVLSKDIDIVVKTNTKDTIYMVISHIDNNINDLLQVNAAGVFSTSSTAETLASGGSAI